MPYQFILGAVPTGSLALTFKANGETLPESIHLQLTDADDTVTLLGPLVAHEGGYAEWYECGLTAPIEWDVLYMVAVLFDDNVVHTFPEAVVVRSPGNRRAPVLRQRIYEVLLTEFLADNITAQPYGTPHRPVAVSNEALTEAGVVIEVGAAYVSQLLVDTSDSQLCTINIPIRACCAIDSAEDGEELTAELEDAMRHLMDIDWRLSQFGVLQPTATWDGGAPEIGEKIATISSVLSVTAHR